MLLSEKDKNQNTWKETLEEAPSEYRHEFSERHEECMSRLMEYEVRSMDKSIHHLMIHIECEKLERVEE